MSRYGVLLNFINIEGLTHEGEQFLKMVGVQTKPTPEHIINGLLDNGAEFLKIFGVRAYLQTLYDLARVYKVKRLVFRSHNVQRIFLPNLRIK